jgi:hypothetical protein
MEAGVDFAPGKVTADPLAGIIAVLAFRLTVFSGAKTYCPFSRLAR